MLKRVVLVMCLLAILIAGQAASAQARPAAEWTPPVKIATMSRNPTVVSDSYGVVHIFWNGTEEPKPNSPWSVIFHIQLINGTWTLPIDVISLPNSSEISSFEVISDNTGLLHLVYTSQNSLYYSRVESTKANDPHAWLQPKPIATSFTYPGIAVDRNGIIYITFPSTNPYGVFFTYSKDQGETWINPTTVFVREETTAPNYTRIAIDDTGIVHIVWSEFYLPQGWPPYGIFYSNSSNLGEDWSTPVALAMGDFDQVNIGIDNYQNIHAVWNGAVVIGGRYHAYSSDKGSTWTSPETIIPKGLGGTSWYPELAFSSDGQLHLISSLDEEGGVVYLKFDKTWAKQTSIMGNIPGTFEEGIRSRITINNGNQIFVVLNIGYRDLYLTTANLNSMYVNPKPTPTRVLPSVTTTLKPTITTTPRTERVEPAGEIVNSPASSSPWLPLAAGIAAPLVLLVGAAFWRLGRRRGE